MGTTTCTQVTYFDTAEDYAAGESERQLGSALKELGVGRDSYVIGSKILPNHCGKGEVRKYTEGMLERLQIDSLDLLMVHWPIDKNSMAHFASHAKVRGVVLHARIVTIHTFTG